MGADQSAPHGHELKSQRDENIPYTSYSIGKPIGDSPKASPKLTSKQKLQSNREVTKQSSTKHDIIVVKSPNTQQHIDEELKMLENIPINFPIIKAGVVNANTNSSPETDKLQKLDPKQLLILCLRYQEHLKQCAEAVSFDQNSLSTRLKEIDFTITQIYNQLIERQRKYAKYAEQIQKINEISSMLNRVKMNVEQTVSIMENLNCILPPEDQLEEFTMKPKAS